MAGTTSHSTNRPIPGGGQRGPAPPEAFGGGGGGGGRGDGDLHDYHQQLQRYRLGLLFTIASITMLFIAFTSLFVARRGAGRFDMVTGGFQSDWIPLALPMRLLLMNTAVLLLSSGLMERARRAARMESILAPVNSIPGVRRVREMSTRWTWATLAMGVLFLLGQALAWRELQTHGGVMLHGPASSFFYLLTGAHALHLVAGLVVLLYACLAAGPRRSLERRCITLEVSGWYWHFMAAIWIYVLVVLVLMD